MFRGAVAPSESPAPSADDARANPRVPCRDPEEEGWRLPGGSRRPGTPARSRAPRARPGGGAGPCARLGLGHHGGSRPPAGRPRRGAARWTGGDPRAALLPGVPSGLLAASSRPVAAPARAARPWPSPPPPRACSPSRPPAASDPWATEPRGPIPAGVPRRRGGPSRGGRARVATGRSRGRRADELLRMYEEL